MLPFSGGLYEQDKYNALTWEIWLFSISKYFELIKEKRSNDAKDNDTD